MKHSPTAAPNLYREDIGFLAYTVYWQGRVCRTIHCQFMAAGIVEHPQEESWQHPSPTHNRLFYFSRGSCCIFLNGEETRLQSGRLYLLPMEQSFEVTYAAGSKLYFAHFRAPDAAGLDIFRTWPGVASIEDADDLADEMVHNVLAQTSEQHMRWQTTILQAVCRFYGPHLTRSPLHAGRGLDYHKLLAFVRQNINASLSVSDIVEHMHVSRSKLSRAFSRDMGIPLKQYLLQMQMQKAKDLLLTTDMTVTELAHELGYPDSYYFHRFFRKNTGQTPLEYRRTQRLSRMTA